MKNQFSIDNYAIAITGGTGTLGSSIAEYLVHNGAKVILLGRTLSKLEDSARNLNAIREGSCFTYKVDVMSEEALESFSESFKKAHGSLHSLINLAGGNLPGATLKADQTVFDLSLSDTETVLKLNLMGTVVPSIILAKIMAEQGFGSIINISSMAAKQSITRVLGYSMAKAGVDIFTKWMANEMATSFGDKIRVNAIAPGFFISNQNLRLLTNEDNSLTERGGKIIRNTPMGRFGDASELNGLVHYLLSNASSFVTGSVYDVDGGFSTFSGV
jgi:NAD(P)-dependent dehydrogenase (short-subunit alcohol dehydrogenase family)